MTTVITVCDTCRRDGWETTDSTRADGEVLHEILGEPRQRTPRPGVAVRRMSCLMGCSHACNVAIQAQGKLGYTLGRFGPDSEAATAIVDYAALHALSDAGLVPFRQWPRGVVGHVVTRHPPLPEVPQT